MISLIIKGTNEVREFEKAHALRVLSLPNSVWEVSKDSNYEFIDNELRRKPSEGTDKSSKKKKVSRGSDKSRK
jgi:hypothetical protein